MKKYNVAIVGATGLVGSTFLQVLKERDELLEFQLYMRNISVFIENINWYLSYWLLRCLD